MKRITLNITKELANKDIKSILFNELKLSSSLVTALKKDNFIMLNNEKATVRKIVSQGDKLTITIPEEKSENIIPSNIPLDIIYEDDDILVVNKPSDMPTHPSLGHYTDTLANAVMFHYQNDDFTFRAVTRLDRDTTGLVLIAKNRLSASLLNEDIKNNKIKKTYFAICCGKLKNSNGRIEEPIKRESCNSLKRIVSPNGQYACTDYAVQAYKDNYSLVKLTPLTGRTHQLRVHLSHIGNPIYADFLYGIEIAGERTRLHCKSLEFIHPTTKKSITLSAPCPDDFFIKY